MINSRTSEGIATRRKRRSSVEGKIIAKKAQDKYRKTPNGEIYYRNYNRGYAKTEKCKAYRASPEYQEILRQFKELNKENKKIQDKKYRDKRRQEDPDGIRTYFREYYRNRINGDIEFKLTVVLRHNTNSAIIRGNGKRYSKTVDLLGCSIKFARNHIESLWEDGMLWENYGNGLGKWNIDHILPCYAFTLIEPKHQRACFNWTNLRPMWYIPNIQKGNRYNQDEFNEYIKRFL